MQTWNPRLHTTGEGNTWSLVYQPHVGCMLLQHVNQFAGQQPCKLLTLALHCLMLSLGTTALAAT
jgi:hypothetical protein